MKYEDHYSNRRPLQWPRVPVTTEIAILSSEMSTVAAAVIVEMPEVKEVVNATAVVDLMEIVEVEGIEAALVKKEIEIEVHIKGRDEGLEVHRWTDIVLLEGDVQEAKVVIVDLVKTSTVTENLREEHLDQEKTVEKDRLSAVEVRREEGAEAVREVQVLNIVLVILLLLAQTLKN